MLSGRGGGLFSKKERYCVVDFKPFKGYKGQCGYFGGFNEQELEKIKKDGGYMSISLPKVKLYDKNHILLKEVKFESNEEMESYVQDFFPKFI